MAGLNKHWGDTEEDSTTYGQNPGDTISETTAPTGFGFTGSEGRDIADQINVTITNGATTSTTEDVTVELYDGVDTTGVLVGSETRSITVAAGTTTSPPEAFVTSRTQLDTGDYYVSISTSGTTLSVDQTDVLTTGASYTYDETATGEQVVTDHDGRTIGRIDPISGETEFPNGLVDISRDRTVTTVTADYTPSDGEIVLVDASLATVTVTLPALSSGLLVDVLATDATNTITVATPGTETISGQASLTLGTDERVQLTSDGTNYQIRAFSTPERDTDTHTDVTGPDGAGGTASIANVPSIDLTATNGASVTAATGADGSADLTIDAPTDTQLTTEQVQDIVGGFVAASGAASVTYDDTNNTLTIGASDTNAVTDGGDIPAGDAGQLTAVTLAPGETVRVLQGGLSLSTGDIPPTGLDLSIATLGGGGAYTVVTGGVAIAGDGTNYKSSQSNADGTPLATYQNGGTAAEQVGLLLDNGTTTTQPAHGRARFEVV